MDLERLSAPALVTAAPRRRRWPLAAALLVVLTSASVYTFRQRGQPFESIAVLPFVNGGDGDTEYLVDGIAETLIDSLSRLPGLRVMSRNAVFRYKGREVEARAVGRDLHVQAVLLGRLVQRGEQLAVSAELVDARDGTRIWGERYNRRLADLVALQEQLGQEIAEQLRLRLTPEQKQGLARRRPQDPEAHREYLRGLYFLNKLTGPDIQTAIGHFHSAIAKDSSYALAYAGLARCYYAISFFSTAPPWESAPKIQAAASKALQLDDSLAEAHTVLANYKMAHEWDWTGAETEFRRAFQLNRGYAIGRYQYSTFLVALGRFDEAMAEAKRAQELDPVSPLISGHLGWVYYFAQRYNEAIEQYRKTLAMDPNHGFTRTLLGQAHIFRSEYTEAIRELKAALELTPGLPWALSALGQAYAQSGDRAAARRVLDNMLAERSRRSYFPALNIAQVHLGLGDRNRALEWLAKAVEERGSRVAVLKTNPVYQPLHSDPRFAELLRRMNLPP